MRTIAMTLGETAPRVLGLQRHGLCLVGHA